MIKFEFHEDLDRETIDSLWEQDIDMDDWDYVLFVSKKYYDNFHFMEEGEDAIVPKSYAVEKLLNGCCSNKWYPCDFKGKEGILGVAYHA